MGGRTSSECTADRRRGAARRRRPRPRCWGPRPAGGPGAADPRALRPPRRRGVLRRRHDRPLRRGRRGHRRSPRSPRARPARSATPRRPPGGPSAPCGSRSCEASAAALGVDHVDLPRPRRRPTRRRGRSTSSRRPCATLIDEFAPGRGRHVRARRRVRAPRPRRLVPGDASRPSRTMAEPPRLLHAKFPMRGQLMVDMIVEWLASQPRRFARHAGVRPRAQAVRRRHVDARRRRRPRPGRVVPARVVHHRAGRAGDRAVLHPVGHRRRRRRARRRQHAPARHRPASAASSARTGSASGRPRNAHVIARDAVTCLVLAPRARRARRPVAGDGGDARHRRCDAAAPTPAAAAVEDCLIGRRRADARPQGGRTGRPPLAVRPRARPPARVDARAPARNGALRCRCWLTSARVDADRARPRRGGSGPAPPCRPRSRRGSRRSTPTARFAALRRLGVRPPRRRPARCTSTTPAAACTPTARSTPTPSCCAPRVLGNPHSNNPTSLATTELVERTRRQVLEFFNAPPDEYLCIFTANASAALRLVGESYRVRAGRHVRPHLRQPQLGQRHPRVRPPQGRRDRLRARRRARAPPRPAGDDAACSPPADPSARNLLAFPAQSNFSGVQHPLDLVDEAHAAGGTCSSTPPPSPRPTASTSPPSGPTSRRSRSTR